MKKEEAKILIKILDEAKIPEAYRRSTEFGQALVALQKIAQKASPKPRKPKESADSD